jgi:hypothetical protein
MVSQNTQEINTHMKQCRLQTYISQKRHRRSLHINKRSNTSEEIPIINLYAPNFIKHTIKDLKPPTVPHKVVVGDFNTPLSTTDRSSTQKINTEILERNERDLLSIPSCNSRLYILLSSPQNFLQNRLYLRSQSKPQQTKEN